MAKLIVKAALRPLGLVDLTGPEPFYYSASKHDFESGKEKSVPDNTFFRGKIREGLLRLVKEVEDQPVKKPAPPAANKKKEVKANEKK